MAATVPGITFIYDNVQKRKNFYSIGMKKHFLEVPSRCSCMAHWPELYHISICRPLQGKWGHHDGLDMELKIGVAQQSGEKKRDFPFFF